DFGQYEKGPESPIISPDLESGSGTLELPEIVRERLLISRFFDFSSKPRPCPESPVSPIITTRQEIFSKKGEGGVLATRSRDARGEPDGVHGSEALHSWLSVIDHFRDT